MSIVDYPEKAPELIRPGDKFSFELAERKFNFFVERVVDGYALINGASWVQTASGDANSGFVIGPPARAGVRRFLLQTDDVSQMFDGAPIILPHAYEAVGTREVNGSTFIMVKEIGDCFR